MQAPSKLSAMHEVLSDCDLVSCILRGNVGPSAYVAASGVCKAWHWVCRSDDALLRLVALYQGGVTKTAFCGLFALHPMAAQQLPHTTRARRDGAPYFLFGAAAVDAALADGMHAYRERVCKRATDVAHGRCVRMPLAPRSILAKSRLEDTLHARATGFTSHGHKPGR